MSYNENNPNGQTSMANSAPVNIASDQSAVAVLDAGIGSDGTSPPALPGSSTGVRGWLRAIYAAVLNIPAQGQALAAASTPVVLPAAQITTLTPPAAITGFATAAKQPALGTAGTPSTDILSVQGRAGMTALVTDGSAVTQPVSAASLPLPTGAASASNQSTANTSLASIATNTAAGATSTKQSDGTQKAQLSDGTNSAAVLAAGTAQAEGNAIIAAGASKTYAFSLNSVVGDTARDAGNYGWVSVHILTQYTGSTPTINFEVSNDGTNWATVGLINSGSGTSQIATSTTLAAIIYHGPLSARYFRVRTSGAYSSGTATGNYTFFSAPRTLHTMGVAASQSAAWNVGLAAATSGGYSFSNITTGTTTTVKSGVGTLHEIIVNKTVASATVTIYDNTAGSGTKIGTITLSATADSPIVIPYDLAFATGLTLVTSGATDLTVLYK